MAITSVDVRPGEQGGGGAPDRTVNLLGPPAPRPLVADRIRVFGYPVLRTPNTPGVAKG
jgi:hypothetical protein